MKWKPLVHEFTRAAETYYVILPALSGRTKRFHVWRIPRSLGEQIELVGNELPIGHARRIAQEKENKA